MRSRNWCLTHWAEPICVNTDKIVGYVYKKEICPKTEKTHWHSYVEFNDKVSMKYVKEIFDDVSIHCESRLGTQKQAIDYVIKEDTKAGEPVYYGTFKKQGKRSDLDEIYNDITEGATLKEILNEHKGNALRIIHAVEKAALIHHGFNKLDSWILLKRKTNKDKLDLKVIDDLENKLLG